ncbi:MAG: hypothetical protein QOJ05_939, partial [Verrucomicrobiota bacterium]
APGKEPARVQGRRRAVTGRRRPVSKELPADQVAAQDEEKIDTDPAKTMGPAGQGKAHNAGVVNRDDKDGRGAEKIETRLPFAIGEPGIDGGRRGVVGNFRNERR